MNHNQLQDRLMGPIASLVTPFDRGGRFCPEELKKEIQFLLGSGIRVLLCSGLIGEFPSMTVSEREQVLEVTLDVARDKALIIAGCASTDVETVLELSDHAAVQGAHAIMVTAPYYFKSTSGDIYEFLRLIDNKAKLPWIIYNNPSTTKTDLPLELIERLSKLRHFAALKESNGDMVRYFEERERFASVFPIIAAAESVLVFQLLAGAEGLMTMSVDFAPNLMQDLWNAVKERRIEEAFAIFYRVLQIRKLMREAMQRGFPAYVPYTKAALEILGIPVGPPRPPLSPLSEAEKARLAQVLIEEVGLNPVGSISP